MGVRGHRPAVGIVASVRMSSITREAVVITGMGVACALGCDVESFWSALLEGASGVRELQLAALSNCRTRIGAPVDAAEVVARVTTAERERLSLASQLAQIAADEALDHAGLESSRCRELGVAAVIGTTAGGFTALEDVMAGYFESGTVSDPMTVPLVMNNAPAVNLSIRHGLTGPVLSVDAGCASSANAIGTAYELISSGRIRIALTGGADATLSPSFVHAWSALRALSERNDEPHAACRPFSLDRDGVVLGDGAGMLVLESESSARERGQPVLARVSGFGAVSDAFKITAPSVTGIAGSMRQAIADASLTPQDIDYINAHGTATRRNDDTESAAIRDVLGRHAYEIPVVSIKPAIGHSIAATGALECVSCVMSFRDQVVPSTLNLRTPDPACDLDYVVDGARECKVDHILTNSFAFGGSNGVLALSRYNGEDR